ncbi:hypothetical protein ACJMK2_002387, partial [Sinanodonta woodiana]
MLNIFPIAESSNLTADQAMNTDIINSVNDFDMPIDNSSHFHIRKPLKCFCFFFSRLPPDVNSHTCTVSQNAEVTCTFNIEASFKVMENQEEEAGVTYWWYSVRSKHMRCRATIIQSGDSKQHKYTSAATIVDRVLNELMPQDGDSLPKPALLVRAANRTRQKMRPKEQRLRIFLAKAKFWYVETTFQIIRDPFKQLFSVHAFVKNDEYETKQLPLAFVFKALKRLFPSPPTELLLQNLKKVRIRQAFRCVYPGVPIHALYFTWDKTIYIQERSVHQICRKGWHRRINAKAGTENIPFHVPVSLLYDESNSVETHIQL